MKDLLWLLPAILAVAWCFLHSLLIEGSLANGLRRLLGNRATGYRLVYNLIALLTLLPIIGLNRMFSGDVVFSWAGNWAYFRFLLLFAGAGLLYGGSRSYDLGYFSGFAQLKKGSEKGRLGQHGEFSRDGLLGLIRHPWYLGSLFFIWSVLPGYDLSTIGVFLVLSCYLILGAHLEERRLLAEFGEEYQRYQDEVSMFIPIKWLMKQVRGGKDGTG